MQDPLLSGDGGGHRARADLEADLEEVRALLQVSHREFVRKELRALAARLEAQLPRPAEVASAPAAAPPSPWAFAGASLAAEVPAPSAAPLATEEAPAPEEKEEEAPWHVQAAPPRDDKEWAMKRDWTDAEFQEGDEGNRARLQEYEDALGSLLRRACARAPSGAAAAEESGQACSSTAPAPPAGAAEQQGVLDRVLDSTLARQSGESPASLRARVLDDPEVLGSALDLVGAYLKNYEVDKAGAVAESVLPLCRARGGLWRLKVLNHLSTVRMKQARPSEALEMLREVEACVNASGIEHDEAWEFWETTYRNFAWIYSSLDREDDAIGYVQRAIDVKERAGHPVSWFDLWDLGRMRATSALKGSDSGQIKASQDAVTKALWLHREVEPKDFVMRAKIWHSVGECSFAMGFLAEKEGPGAATADERPNGPAQGAEALKHYRKALKCFKESHKLFCKTGGANSPLTGSEAQAVAWTLMKLGEDEESKQHHLGALEALSAQQNGWGDGDLDSKAPALVQAMQIVDRIMEVHRRTGDRQGLASYWPAIEALCTNVCQRLRLSKDRSDSAVYEKLVSTCSMVFMASGTEEGVAKSQELMQKYLWDSPRNPQAQLCAGLLRSLQDGQAGAPGPLPPGTDPAVAALLQSMTAASGAAGASPSAAGPDMAALLSSLGAGQGVS